MKFDFPCFVRLFKLFGLFSFKYDSQRHEYRPNLVLFSYGAVFTFIIQVFNATSFYLRYNYIMGHFSNAKIVSITSKIIVIPDSILWIVLNICTMFKIIFSYKKFCQLLNDHLYLRQQFSSVTLNTKYRVRVQKICLVYSVITIFGTAINVHKNYQVASVFFFTLFSHYMVFSQFLLGHFYELILVEKLVMYYRALEPSVNSLQTFLKASYVVTRITKRTFSLFQFNKYLCVVILHIIFSISSFYCYDQIYAQGLTLRLWTASIWQIVLSIVLVDCHSWHRVTSEVSTFMDISIFIDVIIKKLLKLIATNQHQLKAIEMIHFQLKMHLFHECCSSYS